METLLFILSKVIVPFFSPLFLILLAWLVLVLRLPRIAENRKYRRRLLGAWLAMYLVSLPALAQGLVCLWEIPSAGPPLAADAGGGPAWDAVVVLGGTVEPAASAGWQISVNDTAERLESAARLYHAGLAPLIVVSGGSGDIHAQELKEAPIMRRLLEGLGVPASTILEDAESRNTFENAVRTRELLAARGAKDILLVTSALHMRRSEAIFRKAGFGLRTLAVDNLAAPLVLPESFIPEAKALWTLSRVLREMVGYGYYLALGRL
jgi:uncharacterized SAM-binding protein YcdF (DUF218 family)